MPGKSFPSESVIRPGRLWAVVLAGGEGKRLESLTRALYGTSLPKQFAVLTGKRSLLQATVERISGLVPRERTIVVVCAAHEELARRQLTDYPGIGLVAQPRNLDTAAGILLPLARILSREPCARVAFFPSDHHIPNPAPFLDAVREAEEVVFRRPLCVTLVGAVPRWAETEFGWIVPGRRLNGASIGAAAREVERFVEKPPEEAAHRLFESQALWNTFAFAAGASALWALARRHVPELATVFERHVAGAEEGNDGEALGRLYERLSPVSFSRAVLERADDLTVVTVADSGWSDWGSPRRVFQSLEGSRDLEQLLMRMQGRTVPSQRLPPVPAMGALRNTAECRV